MVDSQPVFAVEPDLSSSWKIDGAGARVIHVHNNDGEVLGTADLLEIVGGQVGPAQPFATGGTVFHDDISLSTNQRFVLFVSASNQVLVADLDGPDPTATSSLGSIKYGFGDAVYAVGDWAVWRDPSYRLMAASLTDTVGSATVLSPANVMVTGLAVDTNRPRALAKSSDGRVWVVDLSGPTPGEVQSVPVEPSELNPAFAVASPIDDWVFYAVPDDTGGFVTPLVVWGQDPAVPLGRDIFGPAPIYGMSVFAPGIGWAESVL